MNRTNIEWTDFTWNPVTGCYHDCEYCYARKIAHRFAPDIILTHYEKHNCSHWDYEHKGIVGNFLDIKEPIVQDGKRQPFPREFEPTFHRYRLNEPEERKKPAKIFVSSMGDLFGDWVPDEWIEEVFEACLKAPQHTYFFLTKNPERLSESMRKRFKLDYPENWWIGTSVSGIKDDFERIEGLWSSQNIFWSIEPLLGNPQHICRFLEKSFCDGDYIPEWVIVGAQTGPGAVKPKKKWVDNIIEHCRAVDVPAFLKDNINWPEKIQEWPEEI